MNDASPEQTTNVARPPDTLALPVMLKVIAWGQIWGAGTGTWRVVRYALSLPQQPGLLLVYLVCFLVLVFYTASGVSALFLLRGRHWALDALAAAQLPQLIRLQSPSFIYVMISGVYGLVYGGSAGAGVSVGILSSYSIRWGGLDVPTSFGLNVVAAATLWYLVVIYPSRSSQPRRFPVRPMDRLGQDGQGPPPAR